MATVLLDPAITGAAVRDGIFRLVSRERVRAAVERDTSLEQSEGEAYLAQVDRHLRAFAPLVLQTLRFGSPRAKNDLLEALETLATMNADRRITVPSTAPLSFTPPKWEPTCGPGKPSLPPATRARTPHIVF